MYVVFTYIYNNLYTHKIAQVNIPCMEYLRISVDWQMEPPVPSTLHAVHGTSGSSGGPIMSVKIRN